MSSSNRRDRSKEIETYKIKQGGLVWCSFYDRDQPNYIFTNFWDQALKVGAFTYRSPEHYFQAQKFPSDKFPAEHKDIAERNSSGNARRRAGELSNDPKYKTNPNLPKWDDPTAYNAMLNVIRARAEQKEFRDALLSTGTAYLYEDTYKGPPGGGPPDSRWGGGADGMGKNLLGLALMQVRNELNANQNKLQVKLDEVYLQAKIERANRADVPPETPLSQFAISTRAISSAPRAAAFFAQTAAANAAAANAHAHAAPAVAAAPAAVQPKFAAAEAKTPVGHPTDSEKRVADAIAERYSCDASQIRVSVAPDNNPQKPAAVIKISFTDARIAAAFRKEAGNARGGNETTVVLGPARAGVVFSKLGVGTHGFTRKAKMYDALVHDHNQQQQRRGPTPGRSGF